MSWLAEKAAHIRTQGTLSTWRRALAFFLHVIRGGETPRSLRVYDDNAISLIKYQFKGQALTARAARPQSQRKPGVKYDSSHFIPPWFVYKFYMDNPVLIPKNYSSLPEKEQIAIRMKVRSKALILMKMDSFRRSKGMASIPFSSVIIDGNTASFTVYHPKGWQEVVAGRRKSSNINMEGSSCIIKIFRASTRYKECCAVRALEDWLSLANPLLQGSDAGPGVTSEECRLFCSVNRQGKERKYCPISVDKVQKICKEFLKDFFPSLPQVLQNRHSVEVFCPHVFRHWSASNAFNRWELKSSVVNDIKNLFLSNSGWESEKTFLEVYDIRPVSLTPFNARTNFNQKGLADRLRARPPIAFWDRV